MSKRNYQKNILFIISLFFAGLEVAFVKHACLAFHFSEKKIQFHTAFAKSS